MSRIYHIVSQADWPQVACPYHAATLASEGFAHCSYRHQVAPVVHRFFAGQPAGLLLLEIDAEKVGSALRAEDGGGELFPHVYGPIAPEAIVQVWSLEEWLRSSGESPAGSGK